MLPQNFYKNIAVISRHTSCCSWLPILQIGQLKVPWGHYPADFTWGICITSISHKLYKQWKLIHVDDCSIGISTNIPTKTRPWICVNPWFVLTSSMPRLYSPHLAEDIKTIEDIQKVALRVSIKIGMPIISRFWYSVTWTPWLSVALSQDSDYGLKLFTGMCGIWTLPTLVRPGSTRPDI